MSSAPAGRYRVADSCDRSDNEALRALLRNHPMQGRIALSLEREPDYFRACRLFGSDTTVLAQTDSAQIVGMYGCAISKLFFNGEERLIAYLHGLRVIAPYRHRVRWIREGFASIPHLAPGWADAACCFTSIASDNRAARRLLEAGLEQLPRYRPRGEMCTLILPVNARASREGRKGSQYPLLRRARLEDREALIALHQRYARRWQFSPVLDAAWLSSLTPEIGLALDDFFVLEAQGELRFCAALWDQRRFKQTVVRGYSAALQWLRPIHNLWARATSRTSLPAIGERIEHVFIAFAAFEEESALALDCIEQMLLEAARMGASCAILGLCAEHPLLPKLMARLHARHWRTCIETVTWPGATESALDGRRVQPEAALL